MASDCSVDITQPPELVGIRGDGICDINSNNCNKVEIVGEEIVESNLLSCKFEKFGVLYIYFLIYEIEISNSYYILYVLNVRFFLQICFLECPCTRYFHDDMSTLAKSPCIYTYFKLT